MGFPVLVLIEIAERNVQLFLFYKNNKGPLYGGPWFEGSKLIRYFFMLPPCKVNRY